MKILRFFLFTAALLTITACSDDDAPLLELTNANVAGTYEVVFLELNATVTTQLNGTTVEAGTIEAVGDTFTNAIFTFNADGTYMSSGSYRVTTTINPSQGATTTDSEIESFDDQGTYSVNDVNRTITLDGETASVTLFNTNNLRIVGEDVEVEDGNTITSTSEIRFVRQN